MCDCIHEINERLHTSGFHLNASVGTPSRPRMVAVEVLTEANRKPKGVTVFATCCPFCGEAYPDSDPAPGFLRHADGPVTGESETATHSPAPWHGSPNYVFTAGDDEIAVAFCGVDRRMDGETKRANIYLIAAAPELLAALEATEALIGLTLERTYPTLLVMIREAMKKAKGEVAQ